MAKVKPIPEGNHSVTAGLVVRDGKKAIEFYKTAFGAKLLSVMNGRMGERDARRAEDRRHQDLSRRREPGHGCQVTAGAGGSPVSLNIYTEDCDAMFKKAIAAGGTVKMPLDNMFWGDRYGKLTDPFGHEWGIATHVEDVSEPRWRSAARSGSRRWRRSSAIPEARGRPPSGAARFVLRASDRPFLEDRRELRGIEIAAGDDADSGPSGRAMRSPPARSRRDPRMPRRARPRRLLGDDA
jgi:uncharacterized glyoxalase superfamily protein PhnB